MKQHTQDWIEDFRVKFHRYNMEDNRNVMVEELSGKIEDFISNLLSSQLLSLYEEVEKMKKECEECENREIHELDPYNITLSDVQKIIKNNMENI